MGITDLIEVYAKNGCDHDRDQREDDLAIPPGDTECHAWVFHIGNADEFAKQRETLSEIHSFVLETEEIKALHCHFGDLINEDQHGSKDVISIA